ncbi:MAG: hypothetical protein ACTTH3_07135 [Schwartzia sp. (in: firmicutes)]
MEGSFPLNETAHHLFYSLLERAAAGKFDEAFLLDLVRYHQAFPESERFEALYARYALAQDAPLVALEYGEKAYRKRRFSQAIWRLMADIYRALKRTAEAARFSGWLARCETKAGAEQLRREIAAEMEAEAAAADQSAAAATHPPAAGEKGASEEETSKADGKKERRYVIEMAAEAGAPLRLWIRTKTYEFYWATVVLTAFDGRADRSCFTYRLSTREETPREVRDAEAEHRFLGIAERHTRAVAENGEIWPGDRIP